ncbi:MAG TPA: nuclear transport factor 2 family protein [Oscillatoriaceae cyanobacterium]
MESTPTSLVALAKEALAYYVLGDTEGMLAMFAEDGVAQIPGDPAIVPWAGTFVGRELARFHDCVKDTMDVFEYQVRAFEPHGDTVIFHARERARVKRTGKVFYNAHVGFMTFRGDKVVRYLEYGDTGAYQAAFTD